MNSVLPLVRPVKWTSPNAPLVAAALIALVPGSLAAQPATKVDPATVDEYVKDMFKGAPAEWQPNGRLQRPAAAPKLKLRR